MTIEIALRCCGQSIGSSRVVKAPKRGHGRDDCDGKNHLEALGCLFACRASTSNWARSPAALSSRPKTVRDPQCVGPSVSSPARIESPGVRCLPDPRPAAQHALRSASASRSAVRPCSPSPRRTVPAGAALGERREPGGREPAGGADAPRMGDPPRRDHPSGLSGCGVGAGVTRRGVGVITS